MEKLIEHLKTLKGQNLSIIEGTELMAMLETNLAEIFNLFTEATDIKLNIHAYVEKLADSTLHTPYYINLKGEL